MMKHTMWILGGLMFASPAHGQEVGTCQGADCSAVLKAALEWVAASESVPPARIIVDATASGLFYVDPDESVRTIPHEVLDAVVRAQGTQRGTRADRVLCTGEGGHEPCNIVGGDVLVTLQAPDRWLQDGTQAQMHVKITHPSPAPRVGGTHTYLLLLTANDTGQWSIADVMKVGHGG